MAKKYLFKLYLSGRTSSSERQVKNLKKVLEDKIKDQYSLNIIYFTESPELIMRENVIATPMLIKELPLPPKRVIGDISYKEKLLSALDLSA